ncbi:MAG TPA: polyphenol oxidase family protein [Methylomirabilota bacterium]|nr:polyphenol oxidase family protein [Methylomirabilota bacterium]
MTASAALKPHGDPPVYWTFASLEAAGLPHVTTTRHCPGVTSPSQPTAPFNADARETLAAAGLDLGRVAYARQVHGADVVRAAGGFAGAADVLTTTERAVSLAIFTADCLAIVAWDREAGALAVAHVGWRGTVKRAQQAAVRALCELGAAPERLRVAIAPAIGPCCYEVDAPVMRDVTAAFGAERLAGWSRPSRPGHVMLDLWTANEALLVDAGVAQDRIESARLCTACHPELLYSYRKGNRGRLVTVAALP